MGWISTVDVVMRPPSLFVRPLLHEEAVPRPDSCAPPRSRLAPRGGRPYYKKSTESVAPTSAWRPADLTPKRLATWLPGSVAFVDLRHRRLRELRARCSTNLRGGGGQRQGRPDRSLRNLRASNRHSEKPVASSSCLLPSLRGTCRGDRKPSALASSSHSRIRRGRLRDGAVVLSGRGLAIATDSGATE